MRDGIKLKRRELINNPVRYSPSDYDKAAESFVDRYRGHRDTTGIYQFGHVTVPGISDLDFIVVLRDRLNTPLDSGYSVSRFPEKLRYLYNDTQPFLMPRDVFLILAEMLAPEELCRKIWLSLP